MKKLTLFLATAFALLAQSDSPNYTQSNGAPNMAYTRIFGYSGTNIIYICKALSAQPQTSTITVTSISNANPGVVSAAAHGFYYESGVTQKILVFISGATGMWSTLNGFKVLVPASTGTFTILTTAGANFNTSGFGAWGAQSITVTTRAPKITDSVWSVENYSNDGSNLLKIIDNAVLAPTSSSLSKLGGGSTQFGFPCAAPTIHQ